LGLKLERLKLGGVKLEGQYMSLQGYNGGGEVIRVLRPRLVTSLRAAKDT